jgi:hypothetical protein
MSYIFDINQCNIAQIIGESNRFLFHIFLVHITTCIVEGKKAFFSEELFRTLLITSVAIALYHIFFRKIVEPKVEKMKLICYDDINKRLKKKEELDEQCETEKGAKYSNRSKKKITLKKDQPTIPHSPVSETKNENTKTAQNTQWDYQLTNINCAMCETIQLGRNFYTIVRSDEESREVYLSRITYIVNKLMTSIHNMSSIEEIINLSYIWRNINFYNMSYPASVTKNI